MLEELPQGYVRVGERKISWGQGSVDPRSAHLQTGIFDLAQAIKNVEMIFDINAIMPKSLVIEGLTVTIFLAKWREYQATTEEEVAAAKAHYQATVDSMTMLLQSRNI